MAPRLNSGTGIAYTFGKVLLMLNLTEPRPTLEPELKPSSHRCTTEHRRALFQRFYSSHLQKSSLTVDVKADGLTRLPVWGNSKNVPRVLTLMSGRGRSRTATGLAPTPRVPPIHPGLSCPPGLAFIYNSWQPLSSKLSSFFFFSSKGSPFWSVRGIRKLILD